MNTRLNIDEAMSHPQLFGALPAFQDLESWSSWRVVAKAAYGLPLHPHERKVFTQHTGREYAPPPGGYPELVIIVGVQSGKSSIAGLLMGHAALTGEPGTFALGLCQDHRASMRVLLRYAREPFETLDLFRAEVSRSTADSLELNNGVTLAAYPCRPEAVRGIRACIVVIDELAFFTATDGRPMDQEMLRVARGRVATTGGKVVVISSPYGQSGALWDLHRKHYGNNASSTLVWQASAPEMNPTLSADYLTRMEQDDPEAYKSEVLGEFRSGLSTFLDPESIQACVATGIRERPYVEGVQHLSYSDTAAGRGGGDAFVVVVARVEGERAVLVAVRVWRPPFNPSSVIQEACAFLKSYRVFSTTGDNYASQFPAEQFRLNGIQYIASTRNRSEIYLELLPLLNSERISLLDRQDLLREMRGLERKRGTSGKDRVDHSSRAGSHDDIALACAGALVEASMPAITPGVFVI